jgi:hypothetical protein
MPVLNTGRDCLVQKASPDWETFVHAHITTDATQELAWYFLKLETKYRISPGTAARLHAWKEFGLPLIAVKYE